MNTTALPPKKLFASPFLISCFLGGIAGAIAIWVGYSPGQITVLTGPACLLIVSLIAALIVRTCNDANSVEVSFLFFLRNGLVALTTAGLIVSIFCELYSNSAGFSVDFVKFWLLNCTWCCLLYIFLRKQVLRQERPEKDPQGDKGDK